MAAVFTLDCGKAVEKIATIQIPLHNLFDMRAKEAVSPFKTISIDLFQGFNVVFDALVVNLRESATLTRQAAIILK